MKYIPYGRQCIDASDIDAVSAVLRSDWLTTGPAVAAFEEAISRRVGAAYALTVASGTAALHCAMVALGIGPGDEVIVPAITFAATANCVVYQGGTPVFADVLEASLLIDPERVAEKITPRTKAVIAVDYAGHPCDYERLSALCRHHGIHLVADACHALGAVYRGRAVGSLADMTVFSFHPVKHITTGEGGAIVTENGQWHTHMRRFRNHGISHDASERNAIDSWRYDIAEIGFNYRLTDIQCALGISQLSRLDAFLERRRRIAAVYDAALAPLEQVQPLETSSDVEHAYHLYVVRLGNDGETGLRDRVFSRLRERRIGVNVHYTPVHLLTAYRRRFGTAPGLCPIAERAYHRVLSLPMYPGVTDEDAARVVTALSEAIDVSRS